MLHKTQVVWRDGNKIRLHRNRVAAGFIPLLYTKLVCKSLNTLNQILITKLVTRKSLPPDATWWLWQFMENTEPAKSAGSGLYLQAVGRARGRSAGVMSSCHGWHYMATKMRQQMTPPSIILVIPTLVTWELVHHSDVRYSHAPPP